MKAVIDLARFFASHPLTHTSPIKAWQRWLSWQIKSRLRDEVIVPWIGGQLLAVRRGMTGATGNVYAGLHEFADICFCYISCASEICSWTLGQMLALTLCSPPAFAEPSS